MTLRARWGIVLALWLLAGVAQAGTRHYYYTDPQGTVLAKADASGTIIATYDYAPYGQAVASMSGAPDGPGYTGHVNDPETGLVYMQARYYDPAVGRFLSADPKAPASGNAFNFNRYAYANNNPIKNLDPNGKDCTTADKVTTCATANYRVAFGAQPGFKDFTTASQNYHAYSVPAATPGMSLAADQQFLNNFPTPGFPSPATPQGTPNDATPVIGGLSPVAISPVKSFSLTNQLDGKPVVVNVTMPGHPLQSGIVVREATQAGSSTSIQTWGEGTAGLQAPGAFFANDINGVWKNETPWSAPNPTGCGAGVMNVCNR
jgi:RHS repeat-associated protein